MGLSQVCPQPDRADSFLQAEGTDVHEGVLSHVHLQSLELSGAVITELTAKWPLSAVNYHVTVTFQLILELALTDRAVEEQLPFALPSLEVELFIGYHDIPVLHVMAFTHVLQQGFDVRVLLLAEAAVLLDLLVDTFHVHPEVPFAEAVEGAVLTAELLPRMLAHVDSQVGLNCAGIFTLRATVGLLVGVDPQVGLQ